MAKGIKLNCRILSNGIYHEITTKHPIYRLRHTILTRCYNAKAEDFKYYQGRGIKVFDDWKNNQESFFQWCIDNNWKQGLVLDRINNDKDYEPLNCRFITAVQNLKKMHKDNKMIGRNSANVKLDESQVREIKLLLEKGIFHRIIAEKYGVSKSTISAINSRQNWSHLEE